MTYKIVGNTIVEWDDTEPFIFTMTSESGPLDRKRRQVISINLSDLRHGFEDGFLLHVKEHLIQRRNKVSLTTIRCESKQLHALFLQVINLKLFASMVSVIDESFLLVLSSVEKDVSSAGLRYLKMAFVSNPHSPAFSSALDEGDFPVSKSKKGRYGKQIESILAKALTRATCVHILSRCEQAYDKGELEIEHFSFVNLAFAVFCRPDSYRQIQLDDLVFDTESKSFYVYIIPVKTRVQNPGKICYQINEPLARLLQKQRQHVVARYSYLVDSADIGKLALFPARKLKADKSGWLIPYSNQYFGMHNCSDGFIGSYQMVIQRLFQDARITLGANALRHTVGTMLAQTGASAQTIQAVLKHATDTVCSAYVDIAFQGLINDLSDAMEPAFQSHIPVFDRFRSKNDPIPIEKAVRSDDLESGRTELTGECGKQIQCEHAPIVCYGCPRFIPCWDADHGVNLIAVQREIDDFKQRGKPFQHLIQKAQESKYAIVLVMNAADRYRQAMVPESRL